jgi:hypothetical protein
MAEPNVVKFKAERATMSPGSVVEVVEVVAVVEPRLSDVDVVP